MSGNSMPTIWDIILFIPRVIFGLVKNKIVKIFGGENNENSN